jgi:uncharacterized protein YjcR
MDALSIVVPTGQEEVPRLLSLKDLATRWGVSTHTIRSWVRKKGLRPTRICRLLLFAPEDCQRFLDANGGRSAQDARR